MNKKPAWLTNDQERDKLIALVGEEKVKAIDDICLEEIPETHETLAYFLAGFILGRM